MSLNPSASEFSPLPSTTPTKSKTKFNPSASAFVPNPGAAAFVPGSKPIPKEYPAQPIHHNAYPHTSFNSRSTPRPYPHFEPHMKQQYHGAPAYGGAPRYHHSGHHNVPRVPGPAPYMHPHPMHIPHYSPVPMHAHIPHTTVPAPVPAPVAVAAVVPPASAAPVAETKPVDVAPVAAVEAAPVAAPVAATPAVAVPVEETKPAEPVSTECDMDAELARVESEMRRVNVQKEEARKTQETVLSSPHVVAKIAAAVPEIAALVKQTDEETPEPVAAEKKEVVKVEIKDEEEYEIIDREDVPDEDEEDYEEDEEEELEIVIEGEGTPCSYDLASMRDMLAKMQTLTAADSRIKSALEENEELANAFQLMPTTVCDKGGKTLPVTHYKGKERDQWRSGKNATPRERDGKKRGGPGSRHRRPGQEPLNMENYKPLVQSENRYQIKRDVEGDEKKIRQVKLILNKLSEDNLAKMVQSVKDLKIDNEDLMNEVVNVVFDKAVSEPHFSAIYAKFCDGIKTISYVQNDQPQLSMAERLAMKSKPTDDSKGFRVLILTLSQKTFEGYSYDSYSEADLNAMEPEQRAPVLAARRSFLGAIRFFGELYLLHMLIGRVIISCIDTLLKHASTSEDALEALCRLVTTTGKQLDMSNKEHLDNFMPQFKAITTDKSYSSRMRFLMLDVVELRENGWVSRNGVPVATPIAAPAPVKDRYKRAGETSQNQNKEKEERQSRNEKEARDRENKRVEEPKRKEKDMKPKDFAPKSQAQNQEADEWMPAAKPQKGKGKPEPKGKQPPRKDGKRGQMEAREKDRAKEKEAEKEKEKETKAKAAPAKPAKKYVNAFSGLNDDSDEEEEDIATADAEEEESIAGEAVDGEFGDIDITAYSLDEFVPEEVVKKVSSAVKEYFGSDDLSEVRYYVSETSKIEGGLYNFQWVSGSLNIALEARSSDRDKWLAALPALADGTNDNEKLDNRAWFLGILQVAKTAYDMSMDYPNYLDLFANLVNALLSKNAITLAQFTHEEVTKALDLFGDTKPLHKLFAAIANTQKYSGDELNQLTAAAAQAMGVDEDDAKKALTGLGVEY